MSNQKPAAQPQQPVHHKTHNSKAAPILAALVLGAIALAPVLWSFSGHEPRFALANRAANNATSTINEQSPEIAKVGYSIGYLMGENVQGLKGLNPSDIHQGVSDAYQGKTGSLTREQMEKILMDYQQRQVQAMQQDNLAKGEAFLAQNKQKAGVQTTASGLQYEVLKQGNATHPKATDIVAVQYEGKLLDGKVFDSTAMHGGQPAVFPLNQVIPGWTEGLQLMGEGAKYRFYIPAKLAYGEQGAPQGGIEPNSVLIFDVELVKVNPPADAGLDQAALSAQPAAEPQLQQAGATVEPNATASAANP